MVQPSVLSSDQQFLLALKNGLAKSVHLHEKLIKFDEVGVKAFAARMPNILRHAGFKGIVLEILASFCSGLEVVYQNLLQTPHELTGDEYKHLPFIEDKPKLKFVQTMSEKQAGKTDENDDEQIDKGRLHGNEICTYNFQEEATEDVAGQGTILCNARINVEEASEAEVMMLTENLLTFAKDNFSAAKGTILTKDYAKKFKEVSSPLPRVDFHLKFIRATFVSWSRSDPRVSKEILKGKVLPSSSSNCFSFQSTKSESYESKRLLIAFSDVLGLEVTEDSLSLDVMSLPKFEKKVRRQICITEAEVNQTSSGKWMEECILASEKPPYRITVRLMRQNEPKLSQLKELLQKIPSLKRAADGGPQATYQPSSHVHGNPEERYPVLKDPALVRAGQLACVRLLSTLPSHNKTDYVVKM
ncbi:uncharacterized protein LOC111342986 [Stylophora pistillata]|uniref:uncharacterized protein LOC111342986 n=1 Tax=Stylophora pistillata TaxID=50429 RepID=UPI000C05490E|nr:uncharacterized protein LOC111342986 [Stylophora pistillata]